MVETTCLALLLAIFYSTPHVFAKTLNATESCAELYERGVEAYLGNDFDGCVAYLEDAVEKYRAYTRKLQNCRLQCSNDVQLSDPLYHVDVEDLAYYERAIKNTLCIMKCKNKAGVFGVYNLDKKTESLFENRKPYEYLHLCYFQTQTPQKAASAAFTYLVVHPKDQVMLANLKHYSTMDDVDMQQIVNFEAKDYVYLFAYGAQAYEHKEWDKVIQYMEESLGAYLHAEDMCRKQCEGPFDQGWLPDFIPSIANHFVYCLKCKRQCRKKLNNLNGERREDLLPSHFHYLQYAYFKTGDLKSACSAVGSYLLFYPDDVTMIANMEYYKGLPKVQSEYFAPRIEAIQYIQRQTYEEKLLNFVNTKFKFDDESSSEHAEDEGSSTLQSENITA